MIEMILYRYVTDYTDSVYFTDSQGCTFQFDLNRALFEFFIQAKDMNSAFIWTFSEDFCLRRM